MTFSMPDTVPGAGTEPSPKADAQLIMAKLGLETSSAHASIERSPPMRAIFAEDYSLEDYRSLLRRLREFYFPFEEKIFCELPANLAEKLAHRRKTHLLDADLRALGDISASISDVALPALSSFERRMGGLYVIEGATLGGQIIRKHLHRHFGSPVAGALSFYSGYGKQAAQEWRAFGASLGSLFDKAERDAQNEVVAGANATFSALEAWLAPLSGPVLRGEA